MFLGIMVSVLGSFQGLLIWVRSHLVVPARRRVPYVPPGGRGGTNQASETRELVPFLTEGSNDSEDGERFVQLFEFPLLLVSI